MEEEIMKIVNEWESSDKSAFIEDLLSVLSEDALYDIHCRLLNGIPLLSGD